MKKTLIFAAVAALVICSCGTAKKAANNSSYNSQLQNSQPAQTAQTPQNANPTPARTLRATEPCIALSEEKDFAAWGVAQSYNEKVAVNEASRNAREELAKMMSVAVEGAAEDYLKNTSVNKKSTAATLSEEISTQFYSECVKNSKRIKTSVYDLDDGQIQVYVCYEIRAGFDVLEKAAEVVDNTLTRDQVLEVEFDRERFKDSMKEGLREYKEGRR